MYPNPPHSSPHRNAAYFPRSYRPRSVILRVRWICPAVRRCSPPRPEHDVGEVGTPTAWRSLRSRTGPSHPPAGEPTVSHMRVALGLRGGEGESLQSVQNGHCGHIPFRSAASVSPSCRASCVRHAPATPPLHRQVSAARSLLVGYPSGLAAYVRRGARLKEVVNSRNLLRSST